MSANPFDDGGGEPEGQCDAEIYGAETDNQFDQTFFQPEIDAGQEAEYEYDVNCSHSYLAKVSAKVFKFCIFVD